MNRSDLEKAIRESNDRECREQGISRYVTHPVAIARLAQLLRPVPPAIAPERGPTRTKKSPAADVNPAGLDHTEASSNGHRAA